MKQSKTFPANLVRVLASKQFFWCIVGLLVVQALWIALSNHYPMPFDEDFHLGLIRIYAEHLNPFLQAHPAGADAYGAVTRDPSYLYHYLMSFPYRLIAVFTDNQTAQVIMLRLINIGLFATALVLYRRLLARTGAPTAVIHMALLMFILIPVVPLLAAQVNYDNLFLVAIAGALLLAHSFTEGLARKRIAYTTLLWLAVVCVLTSLIKYAFLPICAAIGVYIVVYLLLASRRSKESVWQWLRTKGVVSGRYTTLIAVVLLVLSLGLFWQRYGVNMVRYHTPLPGCAQVLSVDQCNKYGPWARDYALEHGKGQFHPDNLSFIRAWFNGMWLRLYFSLDGPVNDYQTRGPLPIPAISGAVIAAASLIAVVATLPRLLRRYNSRAIWLLISVATVYVVVLAFDNYEGYLRTGQPVAINGRYLLPFIPLALALAGMAFYELLKKRPKVAGALVVVVLLSQFWGGGALTYILRSSDNWYWQNDLSLQANHAVKRIVGPLVPGYSRPNTFLH